MSIKNSKWWDLDLETKSDSEICMKRIYAWYEGQIIDRAPVRFNSNNAGYNVVKNENSRWKTLKDRWVDEEYQLEKYLKSITDRKFLGETFPIYWPDLGPNVYASFYGCPIEFGEVTSWAKPTIDSLEAFKDIILDTNNEYFKKIDSMTKLALDRCKGKYMVGYTDLHPGMDFIAAWMGTEKLCMDFYDEPEKLKEITKLSINDFETVYNHFDTILKKHNQLSVAWMGIPSFGKMHIPSCDFSSMISTATFDEYCLPILKQEVQGMDHNIFHVDGKGVARHLDTILEVKEIQAIQWVQGAGEDTPILQWLPLIKKVQAAGKSVVVDLLKEELEEFIGNIRPDGLLLCITSDSEEEQKQILKRVEKW
ncbi:hypothetical protein K9O30_00735 [Clostridium bowmanii]|uniref:hypothetical protein n=1 Tax=Clostridium bowmanii TaxID=132925 RepID=UPI001C0DB04D|nr:hypothetical protein [Clostridium bowmanii]MBU3188111.1 hypothetical protein [Clostridium bowmanii]MCA1072292.1 hypothetical protein [Clostridium bowmanii]